MAFWAFLIILFCQVVIYTLQFIGYRRCSSSSLHLDSTSLGAFNKYISRIEKKKEWRRKEEWKKKEERWKIKKKQSDETLINKNAQKKRATLFRMLCVALQDGLEPTTPWLTVAPYRCKSDMELLSILWVFEYPKMGNKYIIIEEKWFFIVTIHSEISKTEYSKKIFG